LLSLVGIPPVNWLDNVNMSMTTLIIFGVWTSLAFNIIILLAGMRNIDKEHYKIAKMFGATDGEIFRKITFPQLIPTFAFLLTVNLISAFKVADSQGSPAVQPRQSFIFMTNSISPDVRGLQWRQP